MIRFADRSQAGAVLAAKVAEHLRTVGLRGRPLVLALPRGGVPVGYEVAKAVNGELDVVVARKIGLPGRPEFGIGAVTPDGPVTYDHSIMDRLPLSPRDLEPVERHERAEARRRERRYRHGRPEPDVTGRVVIVVDDGLATGVTARAALSEVRRGQPGYLIFAAPVCAAPAAQVLADHADAVICADAPSRFGAVGAWYADFRQLSDEDVDRYLAAAAATGTH